MEGSETPQPKSKDASKIGPANGKEGVKEKSRERELISEALASGISRVYTWVARGGNDYYAGFQTVSENAREKTRHISDIVTAGNFLWREFKEESDDLPDKGIKDIVVVRPLEADVFEERSVKVPHKRFLITKYKDKVESQVVGQRPQLMSENGGDSSDPAVAIYYTASDRGSRNSIYRDARKRPGNGLNVSFILPLSLAEKIAGEIERNPRFIREMTKEFVEGKYPSDYIESTWDRFGRPPYEQWDERPDASLYFLNFIGNLDAKPELIRLNPEN